jgi:hypothetical protein
MLACCPMWMPVTEKGSASASVRRRATCSASSGEVRAVGEVEKLVAPKTTQRVRRASNFFEAPSDGDE